ncbi:MAG: UpxY family transcription antiterminator [Muribaculaceae bacterium]|nr:UpxY family transcription antiterminator [Muribaculaceae bacterium]
MRDLKRHNAKEPAYAMLAAKGFEVFTPMRWEITGRGSRRIRREVPVVGDLLFVHSDYDSLKAVADRVPTLQFRFMRGYSAGKPMTVRTADMDRFIAAVRSSESPRYYLPGEITPAMFGKQIRIVGGPLDGYEGRLLSLRGARTRRLIVELAGYFAVAVEVKPEFIQMI